MSIKTQPIINIGPELGILYDINLEFMPDNCKDSIFKFIYEHKDNHDIKIPNIESYKVSELNYNCQTPLMYAAKINNINFVRQLLFIDCCMIDNLSNMAINYTTDKDIYELLKRYEMLFDDGTKDNIKDIFRNDSENK